MYLASKSQNCACVSLVRFCLLLRLCFCVSLVSLAHLSPCTTMTQSLPPNDDLHCLPPRRTSPRRSRPQGSPSPRCPPGSALLRRPCGLAEATLGKELLVEAATSVADDTIRVMLFVCSLSSCSNPLTNKCSINKIAKKLLTRPENTRSRWKEKIKQVANIDVAWAWSCCLASMLPSSPCRRVWSWWVVTKFQISGGELKNHLVRITRGIKASR